MMGMDISVKRENTEGSKVSGPLFPRLHVNDTKKTGTRAPPRNKMALYDQQLSVSSQKFNTPASTLSASGRMHTNMSSSMASQCVIGTKRSIFSPYKNSSASSHPNGRQIMHSTERISDNMTGNFTKMSMLTNSNGNVNVAENPLPKLQCSTLEPCNHAQFRPIQDDATTFIPPRINSSSLKNLATVSVGESCSSELQRNTTPKVKSFISNDLESQQHVRMLNEGEIEVLEACLRHEKILTPITRAMDSELDEADVSKAQGHMDMFKQEKKVCRGDASNEEPKMSVVTNDSTMRSESCPASIVTDVEHQTLKVENDNHQLKVKDRSSASVKDCALRSIITSEAVIKMIGQEEFHKIRNAIIVQQRVFSTQVFELHRLIRVQKLIAGFGNVQHKECPPVGKELCEPTSLKNSLPKSIPEAPSWHCKLRNRVTTTKLAANEKPKPPPLQLSLSSDIATVANSEHNFDKHTNSSLPPMWYLSPQGNQWLLPVMSSSEGLIYKPYPNPLPLSSPEGFLATVYNEVSPTNTTTPREEFLHLAAYGINGSTPPVATTYFAPYEMHISNPCASPTAFKQTTSSNNLGIVHQNSCNMNEAKDGEKKIRGSCDTLPLFPTTPTTLDMEQPIKSDSNDQKIQVIKVIPHNPKLASESAARIVESIQEERKHCCN